MCSQVHVFLLLGAGFGRLYMCHCDVSSVRLCETHVPILVIHLPLFGYLQLAIKRTSFLRSHYLSAARLSSRQVPLYLPTGYEPKVLGLSGFWSRYIQAIRKEVCTGPLVEGLKVVYSTSRTFVAI